MSSEKNIMKNFVLALVSAASLLSTSNAFSAPIDSSAVRNCHGTEPFWLLEFKAKEIVFSNSATSSTRTIARPEVSGAFGHLTSYIAMYQGKVQEEPGRYLNVIIKAAECSDGMSDETYPFSVLVLSGTELFNGCCSLAK